MESRLPKLNFQFKVPARTITGPTTISSLKSTSISTSDTSNIMEASQSKSKNNNLLAVDENKEPLSRAKTVDSISSKTSVNTVTKGVQKEPALSNNVVPARTVTGPTTIGPLKSTSHLNLLAVNENKEPSYRAKTVDSIISKTSVNTVTKGMQKRPALSNDVVEPKRANLKTTMKSQIRPVRPATTVGPIANKLKSASTIAAKPAASQKPSKWDLKGRLEYTNKELTTLKSKHREVSSQLNNMQDEIVSLRESESSNRIKAEEMEVKANKLFKENEILKTENDKFQKENDTLTKDLQESKDLQEKISETLKHNEIDLKEKSVLIEQLKEKLDSQEKTSTEKITKLETENEDLRVLVQDLDRERRYLHNTIQELKGNIRVFCRVRPKIPKEDSKSTYLINYLDECTLEVGKVEDSSNKLKIQRQDFTFDKVFSPNASQADIFEELSMLVQSALEGYNVCVFAYGQTGSGKTYTMEGFPGTENEGMIPRTVKHIFAEMRRFELLGWEYKIEASFLEIYNEQIVDLLDNTRKSHDIRMADSKGTDLYVSNLLVQEINSPEELHHCLLIAQENRAMAATQSNERSSRSHSVARIRLIGTHKGKQEVSIGNLNLVDLAGSERLKNEEAVRVQETKNINKSLANLGHVILALLQKHDHVPYRNSKLTHLLMPSLGGNSKTLMLLNISPLEESYNETLNSLRFGSKVNNCKMGTAKKLAEAFFETDCNVQALKHQANDLLEKIMSRFEYRVLEFINIIFSVYYKKRQ